MKRWMHLVVVGAGVLAMACGSDVSAPLDGGPAASKGTSGGTDTSKTGGGNNGGGQTSNGPVATVTVTPASLMLPVGHYAGLTAVAKDANGVRVAKMPTWTSSNSAIVAVAGDTGVFQAKAVGTAVVTATIEGKSASATITVAPTPPPPPPPAPPAAEFNMTVTVFGQLVGADTSRTERVPGATIALQRVGGITGDTLTTPVNAGTAVADANGQAKFTKLAGGFYTIRVTPPSGSAYSAGSMGIGPPRETDINVGVKLQRK